MKAMRLLMFLFLLLMTQISKAQTLEDDLIKTCRVFQPSINEQAYLAGLAQLDLAVKNYPKQWQAAYYAAWYRLQYLQRADFKTQMKRESFLLLAEESLAPWLNEKGHPEVFILNAYIQVLRMDWFREQDLKKFATKSEISLAMARQKAPEHPRLSVVEGMHAYLNFLEDESTRNDRAREHFLKAEEGLKQGVLESYPMMLTWGWDICQDYLKRLR